MKSLRTRTTAKLISKTSHDALALSAIWIVALLLFLRFMEPPVMSDQIGYFLDANDPAGIGVGVRDFRIGMLLPLNALIRVFGYSELSYYMLPFIAFAGTAGVIYGLGRLYFDSVTGIAAALLYVSTPAILNDVAHLLPDYLSSTLIGAAIITLVIATRILRGGSASEQVLLSLFALVGGLLGWSYLIREFAVLIYPAIGLAMLYHRVDLKYFAALAVGALLCLGLELLWNTFHYGDALTRIRYVAFTRQEVVATLDLEFERNFWPATWQFFKYGSQNFPLLAPMFILGLLTLAGLAVLAPRCHAYLVAWGLSSWIILTIIAVIPTLGGELIIRLHKFRYWGVGLPPLYLAIAAALWLGPRTLMRLITERGLMRHEHSARRRNGLGNKK